MVSYCGWLYVTRGWCSWYTGSGTWPWRFLFPRASMTRGNGRHSVAWCHRHHNMLCCLPGEEHRLHRTYHACTYQCVSWHRPMPRIGAPSKMKAAAGSHKARHLPSFGHLDIANRKGYAVPGTPAVVNCDDAATAQPTVGEFLTWRSLRNSSQFATKSGS